MPQAKKHPAKTPRTSELISADQKIARCLGLLLVRDMDQKVDQVALLRAIGFEVSEVAAMLGMTENHVNVAAHHGRKTFGKKSVKASSHGSN